MAKQKDKKVVSEAGGEEQLEVRKEIIDGLYVISIEDVGLTLTQLQEKIERGKVETFTEKQKEYLTQLIMRGYVQETFRFKGSDLTVAFRTLRPKGTQNAIKILKDLSDDTGEMPEQYYNNVIQMLYVAKYLARYGTEINDTEKTQDEFESEEAIMARYKFIENNLAGLIIDKLYGDIQKFNNMVASSIVTENIENF